MLLNTEKQVDHLQVITSEDRKTLGRKAAHAVTARINELLKTQSTVNMIFAAAPSQNEFLECFVADRSVPWTKINAFHMDEYIGLLPGASQLFSSFLKVKLFEGMPFRSVEYINGNGHDIHQECQRYASLLKTFPPDIVCMGIGENTHIAFNDPHLAKFNDPQDVKVVTLDQICRQQQVNDGCFEKLSDVPELAITLTIPALMRAKHVFCMVPGAKKAWAISRTLRHKVSEQYPSTILRNHPSAILFVDQESYSQVID